jgi:hypothetical protein
MLVSMQASRARARRFGLPLAVVVALSLAAVSGAAPGDVTTLRDAPILGVAAAGSVVGATLDQGAAECWHAELWNAAANKATHLGKKAGCEASGGIRGPAVLGNRVVWATNIGGNLRDWTVWTATTTSPAPKALATVSSVDASDPDPALVGAAGAGIVAYAVGTAVTGLRANGSTAWKWTAPAAVTQMASGDALGQGSELTYVITADGAATTLDATGVVKASGKSAGLVSFCISQGQVIGVKGGALLLAGQNPTSFPLPVNARLVGCIPGIAVYRVGGTVRGIRLATGKDAVLLKGTKVVAISAKGLAWATNSTLHWRPLAAALKPLG